MALFKQYCLSKCAVTANSGAAVIRRRLGPTGWIDFVPVEITEMYVLHTVIDFPQQLPLGIHYTLALTKPSCSVVRQK